MIFNDVEIKNIIFFVKQPSYRTRAPDVKTHILKLTFLNTSLSLERKRKRRKGRKSSAKGAQKLGGE